MIHSALNTTHDFVKELPPLPRAEELDPAVLIEFGNLLHEKRKSQDPEREERYDILCYLNQCWNRLELGLCLHDETLVTEAFEDFKAVVDDSFCTSCMLTVSHIL